MLDVLNSRLAVNFPNDATLYFGNILPIMMKLGCKGNCKWVIKNLPHILYYPYFTYYYLGYGIFMLNFKGN